MLLERIDLTNSEFPGLETYQMTHVCILAVT